MKNIVVLGGGISGYGSAVLAKKKGHKVFLSDAGRVAERYARVLDEWGVEWEQGGHTMERILAADLVVKSPGIPEKAEVVKALRAQGTPIISEMEFAAKYMGKARTICITGSNGKTTTTSLIYKIMRDAGVNVALGGNIGESFAYQVATAEYDWYVLELSSFQLDGMYDFRADVTPKCHIHARIAHNLIDERGGCGLAIGPRDADGARLAHILRGELHLRDYGSALFAQALHNIGLIGYAGRLDNKVGRKDALHRMTSLLPLSAPLIEHTGVTLGHAACVREEYFMPLLLGQHRRAIATDAAS